MGACTRTASLLFLLGGAVTLEDATGASSTFTQHDIFVAEQGSRDSREHLKKVLAIVRLA
jgi:hypothetical protein